MEYITVGTTTRVYPTAHASSDKAGVDFDRGSLRVSVADTVSKFPNGHFQSAVGLTIRQTSAIQNPQEPDGVKNYDNVIKGANELPTDLVF